MSVLAREFSLDRLQWEMVVVLDHDRDNALGDGRVGHDGLPMHG